MAIKCTYQAGEELRMRRTKPRDASPAAGLRFGRCTLGRRAAMRPPIHVFHEGHVATRDGPHGEGTIRVPTLCRANMRWWERRDFWVYSCVVIPTSLTPSALGAWME